MENEMDFRTLALNWLGSADPQERLQFVTAAVKACNGHELRMVKNVATRTLNLKKATGENTCTDWSRVTTGISFKRKVCMTDSTLEVPTPHVLEPLKLDSVQVPPVKEKVKWWRKYSRDDIVSFDVEFVSIKGSKQHKAGTVSVLECGSMKVHNFKVKHQPGSFVVNKYTLAVNGFKSDSLSDGEDFDEIQAKVHALLEGKLVIGWGVTADFLSLDLNPTDYDVFDVQSHFQKYRYIDKEFNIRANPEVLSLKAVHDHFYPERKGFQEGIHHADEDTIVTWMIFRDIYRKTKTDDVESRITTCFDQFECIERPAKRFKK